MKDKNITVSKNNYSYKPFQEWKWRRYDGTTFVSVDDFISEHNEDFFFIGTDSKQYTKYRSCVFTTVIIAYKLHKGGSVLIHKDKTSFMDSLRQRLLLEAMKSVETALYLSQRIPSASVIEVHLDVNPSLKYKSGRYKDELVGLVAAQGFTAVTKPNAFAASKCADRKC